MTWIKGFECRGCGGSLGKTKTLHNGLELKWCFTCCAGDFLLVESEMEGLNSEEISSLMGREWGTARTIYKRLNTPGSRCGFRPSSDHAKYQLYNNTRKLEYEYVQKSKTNRGA